MERILERAYLEQSAYRMGKEKALGSPNITNAKVEALLGDLDQNLHREFNKGYLETVFGMKLDNDEAK
jgi:hypothetical protein